MSEITDASLQELATGFEAGTWPASNWKHSHHLMLAACYILDHPDALHRLRIGIPLYNLSQGGENTADSGYHETLTVFWHEVIREFISSLPIGFTRVEIVARVVDEFAPKRDLFRHYYDFDVVKSREARAVWIPPARALPGTVRQPPVPVKSTVPA